MDYEDIDNRISKLESQSHTWDIAAYIVFGAIGAILIKNVWEWIQGFIG